MGFNRVSGIGPVRLRALLEAFRGVEAAWMASPAQLRAAGLGQKTVEKFIQARDVMDLDAELERVLGMGFKLMSLDDADYPEGLTEIHSPPILLHIWGELLPEDRVAAAIVGTRRANPYGKAVARDLASGLAASGVTIVSGMARGIDGIAHKAALEAGGRTIAVLGSGLDQIYPPEHRKLARSIAEAGAVVTDYPLGTRPEGSNFPPRNRIISGLSLAVIVVQAGERSGALITANFAVEQGRDVFGVPGRIYDRGSKGVNRLISQGAFPATSVDDVLEVLNLDLVAQAAPATLPEDKTERLVLGRLGPEPIHIDELRARTDLPIADLTACLSILELRGQARQVGGMHYVRAREPRAEYRLG
ncbi:MAG: DNA-processing protein DprA [Anaerolineales bacterium]|nr:DNA-processing protein DprA [Anaerolineales bacterium]